MQRQKDEQPKDFAPGYDPYKTDPMFRQLISEDEVKHACSVERGGEREEEDGDERSEYPPPERRPKRPFRKYAPKLSESPHESSMYKRLFEFLVPLNDPWRLTVGFAVLFLLLNAVASRGWFPIIGLGQFASAASVTEIKLGMIESQIFETIKAHCSAPTPDSKQFYSRRRAELLREYEESAGKPYSQVPTCKDLGIREVVVGDP